MGPCKGIYTLSDRRVEIEDFFLEKKELNSQTRKGNYWELVIANYVYSVHYLKENIDIVEEELKDLEYEMISKDIYSLSICAPSKAFECTQHLEALYVEIELYLKGKGVEILT